MLLTRPRVEPAKIISRADSISGGLVYFQVKVNYLLFCARAIMEVKIGLVPISARKALKVYLVLANNQVVLNY